MQQAKLRLPRLGQPVDGHWPEKLAFCDWIILRGDVAVFRGRSHKHQPALAARGCDTREKVSGAQNIAGIRLVEVL